LFIHGFLFLLERLNIASIWSARMNTELPTFSHSSSPFWCQLRTVRGLTPKLSATRKRRVRPDEESAAETSGFGGTGSTGDPAKRRFPAGTDIEDILPLAGCPGSREVGAFFGMTQA